MGALEAKYTDNTGWILAAVLLPMCCMIHTMLERQPHCFQQQCEAALLSSMTALRSCTYADFTAAPSISAGLWRS